eukprot:5938398-Pyramimonas_sp.AAC.1
MHAAQRDTPARHLAAAFRRTNQTQEARVYSHGGPIRPIIPPPEGAFRFALVSSPLVPFRPNNNNERSLNNNGEPTRGLQLDSV